MRFLVVNTDYLEFLQWFYVQHSGLATRPYQDQMQARMESLCGVADFYSRSLRRLGHEAWDVHANNTWMQQAWAQENGIQTPADSVLQSKVEQATSLVNHVLTDRSANTSRQRKLRSAIALLDRTVSERRSSRRLARILLAQVKHYAPDVLLNQAMDAISPRVLMRLKPHLRLLVGQIAAPLPEHWDYDCYDLVLSSLPTFVDSFRKRGIRSEFHRFSGFDPTILRELDGGLDRIPVSFVGGLGSHYSGRIRLLEQLCERTDLHVWGPSIHGLPADSPLRDRYRGMAWGLDMYRILKGSKITVNHHADFAGPHAQNMRLFEATGVGTLLVTDWKEDLHEMFEPDREVVVYRSPEECTALIKHYLENENERETIARSGQQRTLKDHTYDSRIREFLSIVERYT